MVVVILFHQFCRLQKETTTIVGCCESSAQTLWACKGNNDHREAAYIPPTRLLGQAARLR
jgi:hypothetical protein